MERTIQINGKPMEDTIQIDGKGVKFRANGRTIMLYREVFGRDLFKDMPKLQAEANSGEVSMDAMEIFHGIAYIMAKQADPTIPDTLDEWLEQFGMFSLYLSLPEIVNLWGLNERTLSDSKKKAL